MVDGLSLLIRLEQFRLGFKSSGPYLDRTNQRPHSTRTILATLATLDFQGRAEYFDDLFAAVDPFYSNASTSNSSIHPPSTPRE